MSAVVRAGAPALGLVVASAGVFLGALDQTVVATLLPPIVQELQVPFTRLHDAAWIVTGYLLGYTVALPVVGRLADLHGRMRALILCTALFAVASVACGAAGSLEWLIAARALQAAGGGALLPIALALAADLPDPARRNAALGFVAALAEAGGVLGPLYGALLVQWLDWRWVFYLNLPIALLLLAPLLPGWRGLDRGAGPAAGGGRFDVAGAVLLGAGLAALTLGLSQEGAAERPGWLAPALLAAAAALLGLFWLVERGAAAPLVDLALFGRAAFSAANATSLLVGAALIVAMIDVPLWSATVLGRSATEGGLLLLRLTLPMPVGAVLGGLATRWVGPRAVTLVGLLACAAAFGLMAGWPAAVEDGRMTRDLALAGFGFGLLLAPLAATAIGWAGAERGAVAAALIVLTRMVGMMVGLSALTSYGLGRFHSLMAALPLPLPRAGEAAEAAARRQAEYAQAVQSATVTTFHELFLAAAAVCLVALLPALLLRLPGPGDMLAAPKEAGDGAS